MKKHHNKLWIAFTSWFPLGIAITFIMGSVFVSLHYVLRAGANTPQIEMARDTTRLIDAGSNPHFFSPAFAVPIEQSMEPYTVVYDLSRRPITGTGVLHGELPTLPKGVFEYAKEHGEHHFTWQPERGVRSAVVLAYHEGIYPGYVLSGRSLSEVELRIFTVASIMKAGWAMAMLATYAAAVVLVGA